MCLYYIKKELKRRKKGYEVHEQTLEHESVYPPHRPLSWDIYLHTFLVIRRVPIQLKTDIINGRSWDMRIPRDILIRIRILGSAQIITDPHPRGPKTYGSYGSGSGT